MQIAAALIVSCSGELPLNNFIYIDDKVGRCTGKILDEMQLGFLLSKLKN